MIDMQEYSNKLGQFLRKEITEQEWKTYCFGLLCEVMEANKDVLVQLKEA